MIPTGIIVAWSGLFGDVPAGWKPCTGADGTPDLRAFFLRGSGSGVATGDLGYSNTHNHIVTGDSHVHGKKVGTDFHGGPPADSAVDETTISGHTDSAVHLPTAYGVWWIIKVDE